MHSAYNCVPEDKYVLKSNTRVVLQ